MAVNLMSALFEMCFSILAANSLYRWKTIVFIYARHTHTHTARRSHARTLNQQQHIAVYFWTGAYATKMHL
jgi:uncharacterized protein involved in tolerance to divalent cations